MTTAAAIFERAKERRVRLWNPPNGRVSSEVEIISEAEFKRRKYEIAERRRLKSRLVRETYHAANMALLVTVYRWLIHRRPQAHFPTIEPPLIDGECTWPVSVRDVCRAACRHFEINILDFVAHRRHARLVRCRHIAMYLAREMTVRSMPQIGEIMGGRDHTTILSGIRKVTAKLASCDASWTSDVEAVRALVMEGRQR